MIEIISATILPERDFWKSSPLGLSLVRLAGDTRLVPRIAFANQRGLPDVYNARILAADSPELLVFMHDDVWIEDCFVGDRVIEGLRAYDVIGVVGNRRRLPHQPGWPFMNPHFAWDDKSHLSGWLGHGDAPLSYLTCYGAAPAPCELLDGLFLAVRKSALLAKAVVFDPRFEFHFYDMDFCRSARQRGLRLGTWPIAMTHRSPGFNVGSPLWMARYREYLEKWRS
jgi:GT2 family glycosyltransferase